MRVVCKQQVRIGRLTLGGPRPLICLPLVADTPRDLLAQADEFLPLSPDLFEWRVDAFREIGDGTPVLHALKALKDHILKTPLIFTCRIDLEGGSQSIPRDLRGQIIEKALETGLVDIVDIELCNDTAFIDAVVRVAKKAGTKVILSFHDFEKTPAEEEILDRLVRAQERGASIAKVAVTPKSHQDVLRLLQATLTARTRMLTIPMITISMGEAGKVSRVAGGLYGSDVTFAAGKKTSAPGQIPMEDLRSAMSVLYGD